MRSKLPPRREAVRAVGLSHPGGSPDEVNSIQQVMRKSWKDFRRILGKFFLSGTADRTRRSQTVRGRLKIVGRWGASPPCGEVVRTANDGGVMRYKTCASHPARRVRQREVR